MEMVGLSTYSATKVGFDWAGQAKKAGKALLPTATSAADAALSDKPKDAGSSGSGSGTGTSTPKGSEHHASGDSFSSKTIVGPVKVWMGLVAVGVAGAGVAWWKLK